MAPFPPSSIVRSSAAFAWADPGSAASRSNSCGVSGMAGSALTAETLATEVSASEIGETHGPCSSSHLACALPCTAPSFSIESAGDDGGPKPVVAGSGWSGSAVWFTDTPGTWIGLPAIAAPNGAASAIERSCARYVPESAFAVASPMPASATDWFGTCCPSMIESPGTVPGSTRTTPMPVPASATIGPGGGTGGPEDAGGWFGSSGIGIGVVVVSANAAGTLSPAMASDTVVQAAKRRSGRFDRIAKTSIGRCG